MTLSTLHILRTCHPNVRFPSRGRTATASRPIRHDTIDFRGRAHPSPRGKGRAQQYSNSPTAQRVRGASDHLSRPRDRAPGVAGFATPNPRAPPQLPILPPARPLKSTSPAALSCRHNLPAPSTEAIKRNPLRLAAERAIPLASNPSLGAVAASSTPPPAREAQIHPDSGVDFSSRWIGVHAQLHAKAVFCCSADEGDVGTVASLRCHSRPRCPDKSGSVGIR